MIRLYVACEGQTEETFVKKVLEPHLHSFGVVTAATILGTPKQRASEPLRKGGGGWHLWEGDLRRLLRSAKTGGCVTTLVDLYRLPTGFPGCEQHGGVSDTALRCDHIEAALFHHFDNAPYLVPHVQRHEFEALVLGGLEALRSKFSSPEDLRGLDALKREIASTPPEDVDDGPNSAPSKRLKQHIPGYSKLLHGPDVVRETGLDTLRTLCPRFGAWLNRLESLRESA